MWSVGGLFSWAEREGKNKMVSMFGKSEEYIWNLIQDDEQRKSKSDTQLLDFSKKLTACLPIGYTATILAQTQNDLICYHRRIEISNSFDKKLISVTDFHYDLNFDVISRMIVIPVIASMKKENKMTREEAVNKIQKLNSNATHVFMRERGYAVAFVAGQEALGILKFEEEKLEIKHLCSAEKVEGISPGFNFRVEQWHDKSGEAKFVLWHNGEIVWRSWKA